MPRDTFPHAWTNPKIRLVLRAHMEPLLVPPGLCESCGKVFGEREPYYRTQLPSSTDKRIVFAWWCPEHRHELDYNDAPGRAEAE